MLETLRELPLVGVEMLESTRRVVREPGVPLKLLAGRNRSDVAEERNRPVESVRLVAMSVQLEPLSHCHLP